jgi:hypothetical protein
VWINVKTSGARYHIVNTVYFLVFCVFAIWVYAAVRPRFGAGARTALMTALGFWFVGLLLAVNFVNLGVFPVKVTLLSVCFNLLELPPAIVAGASIYREDNHVAQA